MSRSDAKQVVFDALHRHAVSNTVPTCCIVEAVVACNECCVICQLWLSFQNLHRTVNNTLAQFVPYSQLSCTLACARYVEHSILSTNQDAASTGTICKQGLSVGQTVSSHRAASLTTLAAIVQQQIYVMHLTF